MSTENENTNTESSTSSAKNNANAANVVANVMALKDSNPKVFYGAIAGVVLLLLIMMMSGGGSSKNLPNVSKNLSVGQTYTLQGANSYADNATVSLAAAPGTVAAFGDDEEETAEKDSCKQIPQGTRAKIIDIQKTAGVTYAHVEVLEGNCQGRKGWALSIDIQ